MSKNWHLVMTKTGEQEKAEDNLGSQCYEVYNPKIKGTHSFPGYLFVNFDHQVQSAHTINSTYGVHKLVTFGNELVRIHPGVIPLLKERFKFIVVGSSILALDRKHGDTVKLKAGPFKGLDAIFQEKSGQKRSIILLNFLGSMHRMVVEDKQIA